MNIDPRFQEYDLDPPAAAEPFMKPTVFTLHVDEHDAHHLEGVFSTREKAEAAAVEAAKIYGHTEVEEVELDAFYGKKAVPQWRAEINLSTGELLFDPPGDGYAFHEGMEYVWEDDLTFHPDKVDVSFFDGSSYVPKTWHVHSMISQEAARTLAKKLHSELSDRGSLGDQFLNGHPK